MAMAMEVCFPARRDLDIMGLTCAPKVSRSWPRVKAVAGLSSSPEMMSPLTKPCFSAGEAARVPVTTKGVQVVAIGEGEKMLRTLCWRSDSGRSPDLRWRRRAGSRFAGAGKFRNAALRNAFGVTNSTSRSN